MDFNTVPAPGVSIKIVLCVIISLFIGVQPSMAEYKMALPGYKFEFPQDHCSHDQFKSEWWYYTGHLKSKDNKSYGFELTFFRLGGDYEPDNPTSAWKQENYNLAHFAITDESGKSFYFDEKGCRARLDAARARSDVFYIHNQGWSVTKLGEHFVLNAETKEFAIHLLLKPLKLPVVHGVDGVQEKAFRPGCATHVYSITRMATEGLLFVGDKPVEVTGISWMDHEFGSYKMISEQCGWDWYSLQLDDNRELMILMLRRIDGTIEAASSGTIVDAKGHSKHLRLDQFEVTSTGTWHSNKSGGNYPMGWHIVVPGEKVDVTVTATVQDQELNTAAPTGVTYWEGSVNIEGTSNGKDVAGQGYVEMTGYCEKFKGSII